MLGSAYTPAGRRYSLRLPLTMGRCQDLGLWVTMTACDDDEVDDNAGYDEDCECDSVCTNCEHVPVTEWSCVECDKSMYGEVEKWAFMRGKHEQICDACIAKPEPVPVPAVPVCFNCDEHFTGDQTSDDFLNWEYCEGRKQWACHGDCRYKWDEPCVDDTCAYCGNAPCDDDACVCCDNAERDE